MAGEYSNYWKQLLDKRTTEATQGGQEVSQISPIITIFIFITTTNKKLGL